jgi:hypothetical protein
VLAFTDAATGLACWFERDRRGRPVTVTTAVLDLAGAGTPPSLTALSDGRPQGRPAEWTLGDGKW